MSSLEQDRPDAISGAIWLSVDNLLQLSIESAALLEEIEHQLSQLPGVARVEGIDPDYAFDDNELFCWKGIATYLLHPADARKNAFGAIAIGTELWRKVRDDDTWPYARQALLYVGFAPGQDGWTRDALSIGGSGEPEDTGIMRLAAPMLWERTGRGAKSDMAAWAQRTWFYCIPLGAITGPDRVTSEITGPLESLLEGHSPVEAFRNAQAVIRFGQDTLTGASLG